MKKKSLLIPTFCLLSIIPSLGQILFEKGYFINNSDEHISCFIKNNDWKHNPSSFEYKTAQNGAIKTATIEDVKEFGIPEDSKFIRFKVKIDKSSENLDLISRNKQPEYLYELLFLKCLVEGKGNLYSFEATGLERYFYSVNGEKTKQLVFKSYFTKSNQLKKNKYFQQQLWNSLKCENSTMGNTAKIDYDKDQLVKYFVNYNQCQNASFINHIKKAKRKFLKLAVRPGIMVTSLAVFNEVRSLNRDFDFGSKLNYRIGLEAEFVLPFNKNKWAIFVEPTYHSYTTNDASDFEKIKVKYKSIEIPAGLRHYFFLENGANLFLNGAFVLELPLSSRIDYEFSRDLLLGAPGKVVLGIGYKVKNKYSLELRLGTSHSVFNTYAFWESDYKRAAIIFGYNFY